MQPADRDLLADVNEADLTQPERAAVERFRRDRDFAACATRLILAEAKIRKLEAQIQGAECECSDAVGGTDG